MGLAHVFFLLHYLPPTAEQPDALLSGRAVLAAAAALVLALTAALVLYSSGVVTVTF